MAKGSPNPSQYESHFPGFRNVDWNPDPEDLGATVQGPITQTLTRNTLFDRLLQTWRILSGDRWGRTYINPSPINTLGIVPRLVNVFGAVIQLCPPNQDRQFLFLFNTSTNGIALGFGQDLTAPTWLVLPGSWAFKWSGYTGGVIATGAAGGSAVWVVEL